MDAYYYLGEKSCYRPCYTCKKFFRGKISALFKTEGRVKEFGAKTRCGWLKYYTAMSFAYWYLRRYVLSKPDGAYCVPVAYEQQTLVEYKASWLCRPNPPPRRPKLGYPSVQIHRSSSLRCGLPIRL